MIRKYRESQYFQLVAKDSGMPEVMVNSSKDVYEYAKQFWNDGTSSIYESFFIILLNRSNVIKGHAKIAQGGIISTVVDPVLIAKYAIDSLSMNIVLVHNHPSNILKPSVEDRKLTKEVQLALGLFRMNVLDHMILGKDTYYSFLDNGDM